MTNEQIEQFGEGEFDGKPVGLTKKSEIDREYHRGLNF